MIDHRYELVKFADNGFELEVNVSPTEETVWLDVNQLALLFDVQVSSIVKHISNIISSGELDKSTISILEKVQTEGGRRIKRKHKIYNLDMIIAVGYRVNSIRGTVFRRWANTVLKQFLLKGYAIDSSRVLVTQENYLDLVNVVNRIDINQEKLSERVERLEEKHPDFVSKIFFKGQLWDATNCIEKIISEAQKSLILIDGYVDRNTLDLVSRKNTGVPITVYTSRKKCHLSEKEISDFNSQYGPLSIKYTEDFHDRFLILDDKKLYHIGASIKDAGKKAFEISINKDTSILEAIFDKL